MKTMKAVVVCAPGDVQIRNDVPVPACGPYEALVKVAYCGFCNGSDFQIINQTMLKEEGLADYPTVLGHEGAGCVVELGEKVRHIQLGDRFIHANLRPDVGNGYTKTYGGMAEYGLVVDAQAMLEDGYAPSEIPFYKKCQKIPRDFPLVHGAMLLSLSESLSAARNFGAGPGKEVLIFGAGPMGTAVAAYCRLIGADRVVIVDSRPERLEGAKRVAKVDETVNFAERDVFTALAGQTFDIAIDAVGMTSVILQATKLLKPGGVVGSMGVLKADDLTLRLSDLQNNTSVHMLNFPYGEYDVMEENIRLIQQKKINPEDFYSHVVDMEDIHTAMELVRSKQALKVILKIEK
ncbi:MAG: zinc-binding dehydrogenase [Eubacteriales bacterium]|nr:zinc-binding dehydrogenase [Eubacteriales bacterium]